MIYHIIGNHQTENVSTDTLGFHDIPILSIRKGFPRSKEEFEKGVVDILINGTEFKGKFMIVRDRTGDVYTTPKEEESELRSTLRDLGLL